MEVIELTSTLGIHACNIRVQLLVEVLKEKAIYYSHPMASPTLDAWREKLKAEFTKNKGYWHTFWDDFLRLGMDPDSFEAYLEFSSVPWVRKNADGSVGGLELKIKELIYCAFDATATHLYVLGLKLHFRNAVRYGASPRETMEVLEIATGLNLRTGSTAVPIVMGEVQKFESSK